MAQVINTNIASLNAQRNLNGSQRSLETSLQRLSSGLRINSAKDDAAGLAISDRMTAQIRGYNQAMRNANDGISLSQTAEGALGAATDLLQRIRELAIQSANSTNSASDRASLQSEVNQLKQEIDRVATQTEFNGLKLLDGSFTSQSFQVGANANQIINVSLEGASTSHLQDNQLLSINTASGFGTGSATAAASGTAPAASTIGGQTLTISGPIGTVNDINIPIGSSAFDVAAAITSREGETSVIADATNSVTIDAVSASGTVSFDLSTSNGSTTKTISAQVTTTDLSALVIEINRQSGSTGVTAILQTDGKIKMTQAEGKDIVIENFNNSNAGTMTVTSLDNNSQNLAVTQSTRIAGSVNFHSSGTYTASSNIAAGAGSLFNVAAGAQVGSVAQKLSTIDISSASGSQDALAIVDSSLAQVNSMRASLGAVQNRMESTISNLEIQSENISAARSRIMDADFAAETAALARSQILQQAGTAMLAQANQIPQGVLTLLQG